MGKANIQSLTMQVQGMDELNEGLARLSAYAHKDVIKSALKAAAEVVAEEARKLAPVKTGQLQRAIKVRMGRARQGNLSVLASVGKKWFKGDQFYGAFLEFGYHFGKRADSHGKGAQGRKEFKGLHFMQYAFEEKAQEALDTLLAAIKKGLEEEARK